MIGNMLVVLLLTGGALSLAVSPTALEKVDACISRLWAWITKTLRGKNHHA
jgi:hypothetical protein